MSYDPISGDLNLGYTGTGLAIQPDGSVVYKVGGTTTPVVSSKRTTPVGNMFKTQGYTVPTTGANYSGTGIYAPRFPRSVTAPATNPPSGMDIETRRGTNAAGVPTSSLTAQQEANKILSALDSLGGLVPKPSGGGGGLSSQQQNALRAIATLQGRLSAPSETDALQATLAEIYKQAEDRIKAAGTELSGALSTPTATRAITQVAPVGATAMSDYLNAIGASGADVSAQQALSNSILQSIAGNAQQYSQGLTQSNDAVRQALLQAVPANQLAGISQASLNRAAMEAQLASRRSSERQSIQDQILELALKYGVKI